MKSVSCRCRINNPVIKLIISRLLFFGGINMNNDIWYSYHNVLSRNAILNFIIGERGVGKSYGIKKYVIKRFLKYNKQFIYLFDSFFN